ncbi:MAG: CapA family protein [Solirubrobacterales bacterium]|nr:CapA family protein [Solirubrobacterales bacterium]
MAQILALAGDTMLGRGVAQKLLADPAAPLVAPEVARHIADADAFVLNLECCISDRGAPFPDSAKPFFFRAPPVAAQRLAELGVDVVTLANNHALDYRAEALLDTLHHLHAAGIATVGAGASEELARKARQFRCGGLAVQLLSFSDHPASFAAGADRPGIAFADLRPGLPAWVREALRSGPPADAVVVMPHWGPNMVAEPLPYVRHAAAALLGLRATLIAGHSAHVFQGAARGVLFDMGDFLDDYAVDPALRNDLGLLWLVELDSHEVRRIRALPLALDYSFTRLASPSEADWILRRLRQLCAPLGTEVESHDGLLECQTTRLPGTR